MSALIIIMFPVHFIQQNKQWGKQVRGGDQGSEESVLGLQPLALGIPNHPHSFFPFFVHSFICSASHWFIHLPPHSSQYSYTHSFIHLPRKYLLAYQCDSLQDRCQEAAVNKTTGLCLEELKVWRQTTNTCNGYKQSQGGLLV